MIALMLLAAAAAAQTPAPAPAPTGPQTVQQRFDTAVRQTQSGQCLAALANFKALELLPSFKDGTLAGAMLQAQQGQCLVQVGTFELGEAAIQKSLPLLRKAGTDFDVDIANSLMALGDAAMARWDYDRAKALYVEALAIPGGGNPITLNIKLAKAMGFDGGPEPLQYADKAIQLAEQSKTVKKDDLAALHTVHARILLNQGRNKEAYDELKKALALSGGLDLKVSLVDAALRSDLALAALLSGDESGAHEYLAYTGAGRTPKTPFSTAVTMEPPVCGSETGLKPADFAIVEFAIGEDGRVIGASPIYTRGSAKVAAQFARAVNGWVWDPERLKDIPPFFLLSTHAEVRCTTVAQEVPDMLTPMRERFAAWATQTLGFEKVAVTPVSDHAWAERLKTIAATSPSGARTVAAYGLLAITAPVSTVTRDRYFSQAIAASDATIPVTVSNWLEVELTTTRVMYDIPGAPSLKNSALISLLAKPAIMDDALASDTAKLAASARLYRWERPAQWLDLTSQVAADDRLSGHHPLRQLANLSLANNAAQKGDFATANQYFAATGLTEEQCALIGARPSLKRSALGSNSFPDEAMKYGFEGWVRLEFDILDSGRTASVRPIIAYPPFVFAPAATKGLEASVFEASFRPAGGAACSAQRQNINFRIAE